MISPNQIVNFLSYFLLEIFSDSMLPPVSEQYWDVDWCDGADLGCLVASDPGTLTLTWNKSSGETREGQASPGPIRGQCPGHVISLDQSEASEGQE